MIRDELPQTQTNKVWGCLPSNVLITVSHTWMRVTASADTSKFPIEVADQLGFGRAGPFVLGIAEPLGVRPCGAVCVVKSILLKRAQRLGPLSNN